MDSHDCDWSASALRVVVERPSDWLGAVIPMAPATASVEYCRQCGALRLSPDALQKVKAAAEIEAQKS